MARQDDRSVSCGCGGRLAVGRLPFQLGGHCSGCGIIADTARQLPSLENSAKLCWSSSEQQIWQIGLAAAAGKRVCVDEPHRTRCNVGQEQ